MRRRRIWGLALVLGIFGTSWGWGYTATVDPPSGSYTVEFLQALPVRVTVDHVGLPSPSIALEPAGSATALYYDTIVEVTEPDRTIIEFVIFADCDRVESEDLPVDFEFRISVRAPGDVLVHQETYMLTVVSDLILPPGEPVMHSCSAVPDMDILPRDGALICNLYGNGCFQPLNHPLRFEWPASLSSTGVHLMQLVKVPSLSNGCGASVFAGVSPNRIIDFYVRGTVTYVVGLEDQSRYCWRVHRPSCVDHVGGFSFSTADMLWDDIPTLSDLGRIALIAALAGAALLFMRSHSAS